MPQEWVWSAVSPIPVWQVGGGGFEWCLGWGQGCVGPSGASWCSQECWDAWAAPQDKVQGREGAGPGLSRLWGRAGRLSLSLSKALMSNRSFRG